MTPAAFTQTDPAREAFVATRREEALRVIRSPRRFTSAFIASDAQAPLFHAWRP
jgi:hypothetical protein